ncbi:Hypothetical protein CINCED_3A025316 [Cinara cedri]|uniref:Uncharacterized protein n=1 Tax=Cinara cedri TaxID=506608 RepID=A0A5E4N407_9HEMI|nr:Hypothetical protein CINCED_3A025316 [Cinara cedri]
MVPVQLLIRTFKKYSSKIIPIRTRIIGLTNFDKCCSVSGVPINESTINNNSLLSYSILIYFIVYACYLELHAIGARKD